MNIGDRVRTIRSNHEGVVTRLLSEQQIEVEIEDGFRLPFMKSDLVVIAREEQVIWGKEKGLAAGKEQKPPIFSEKGLFLAMTHFNDKLLEVFLINNTDFSLPFSFGDDRDMGYFGIAGGVLAPRSYQKVHELSIDKFERWDTLIIQFLFHRIGVGSFREPLVRKMRFKATTFFKALKKEIPLLGGEGYVFQLDEENRAIESRPTPERIAEKNTETQPAQKKTAIVTPQPAQLGKRKEVDLHADKLNIAHLSKEQILHEQLQVFEKQLDNAILEGCDEIIFIHGSGNGTLKNEVQRRLSKHPYVAFFQDAQKEKFGYGATLAKLK